MKTKRGSIRIPGSNEEQALLISHLYYDSIALIDVSTILINTYRIPCARCRNWRQINDVF